MEKTVPGALPSLMRRLIDESQESQQRVEAVRKAISGGVYTVSAGTLADTILRSMRS